MTALPFEDARFDLVWSQHVSMNVRDRDKLYREFRRVLEPGGRFAFYDPIAADGAEAPFYPVPWAQTADTSTLLTKDETIAALARASFAVRTWDDVTVEAGEWLRAQSAPAQPTLSPGTIVGPRMPDMIANFGRNMREGRLRLVMATFA